MSDYPDILRIYGANDWTLRCSSLDAQIASHRRAAKPAPVIRMQIQSSNLIGRLQHGTQLQLCVPQVLIWWLVLMSGRAGARRRRGWGTAGTSWLVPGWRSGSGSGRLVRLRRHDLQRPLDHTRAMPRPVANIVRACVCVTLRTGLATFGCSAAHGQVLRRLGAAQARHGAEDRRGNHPGPDGLPEPAL
jgi:hypothetical protein